MQLWSRKYLINSYTSSNLVNGSNPPMTIALVIGLLIYSKKINDDVKEGTLTGEQITSILNQVNSSANQNTTSASTEIGKSINEIENEANTENSINTANTEENKTNSNKPTLTHEEKPTNFTHVSLCKFHVRTEIHNLLICIFL